MSFPARLCQSGETVTPENPMRIYLDHNATTPVDGRVREAMDAAAQSGWANPSSLHQEGRAVREVVEAARREVAELVGCEPDEVVFTSGGTEADALGVVGLARLARSLGRPARAAAPDTEHPAVPGAVATLVAEGFSARPIPVAGDGRIDPDDVERICADGAAVVAFAMANHETGVLQDVAALAEAAHRHGALVFCDAVQAAGKLSLDVALLGVDALAVSAHKLYGPKGAGALWVARRHDLAPLVAAGHQERGRRPGTENVTGIAGFGAAARLAAEEGIAGYARVAALRDDLERGLVELEGTRIHGAGAPRTANTVCAGFDGALGEVVVANLDLAGVAVSSGAACTSGSVKPSTVLRAMGLSEEQAREGVRFSLGLGTTEQEVKVVLEVLPDILARARKYR